MNRVKRREGPGAKRRADLDDPGRNRRYYLGLYRTIRTHLGMGATAAQVRRAFELAAVLRRWDTGELDEYERETIDSIRARALDDAIEGRPPCPIWGDHEPERGRG
jgi:hypothetical protein